MASGGNLTAAFKKFATKANGNEATSKDITKWFTDAGCLGKSCSSNNLDIAFSASKTKGKPNLQASEVEKLLTKVAPQYKTDKKLADNEAAIQDLRSKLCAAEPILKGTKQSKTGGVDRMTDASKYTGAHKERFDAEGKGKGAAGRKEEANTTGYVGGYKGEGSYGKK